MEVDTDMPNPDEPQPSTAPNAQDGSRLLGARTDRMAVLASRARALAALLEAGGRGAEALVASNLAHELLELRAPMSNLRTTR
jgi:hypothetical protein